MGGEGKKKREPFLLSSVYMEDDYMNFSAFERKRRDVCENLKYKEYVRAIDSEIAKEIEKIEGLASLDNLTADEWKVQKKKLNKEAAAVGKTAAALFAPLYLCGNLFIT